MFSLGGATMMIRSTALLEESEILALLQEQGQPWAAPVANWKVETGEDSLGYPAIWVWVLLATNQKFELETSQGEFDKLEEIRKQVCERIANSGEKRWVYVRFRTKAGQEELDELERQEAALEEDQEAPA
ncbi:MAG: hypothetical protein TQ37_07080 [Candidatus Synechococcus spongiarum 15L]|uniref:Uncharacterized protein n=2 Tax=Candidatus Synechococcus spongiarum TaxID=431041 RepID=A0A1T1CC94_9SYNE|nr:MAG: hypothetical protein TQ37_07080 [Candidatus Synechococcus spongiarum 15L]OOV26245.1 hypothetical protein BV61_06700 [Candidatus Synechococcus spongiarum LMB bulk15M]